MKIKSLIVFRAFTEIGVRNVVFFKYIKDKIIHPTIMNEVVAFFTSSCPIEHFVSISPRMAAKIEVNKFMVTASALEDLQCRTHSTK